MDGESRSGPFGEALDQRDRLLSISAAALERTQVGDADEATALLEQVVTLDGTYKPPPKEDD